MNNKTKTIPCASLITAIVLPYYGGMQFVDAAISKDEKQQLIDRLEKLEQKLTEAENEEKREKIEAKIQKVLEQLFNGSTHSSTEFTTPSVHPGATGEVGGSIHVDGIHTGCNGYRANWNFAAQTYSGTTWWNANHHFPNALSVGTSPNCLGANWSSNLYVESIEVATDMGCHANLIVSPISSYWLNCEHSMDGLVITKIRAYYEGQPYGLYGYGHQWV